MSLLARLGVHCQMSREPISSWLTDGDCAECCRLFCYTPSVHAWPRTEDFLKPEMQKMSRLICKRRSFWGGDRDPGRIKTAVWTLDIELCGLDKFPKLCFRIRLYSEKWGFYDLVDLGTTGLDPVKSIGLLRMCDKLMCVWLSLRLKLKTPDLSRLHLDFLSKFKEW